MASNAVDASSAGEGSAAVTGYTVNNPSYSTSQCPTGVGHLTQRCVTGVSFTLTSNATSAPANAQPKDLHVTFQDSTDDLDYAGTGTGKPCTISGWATTGTGAGSGTVSCSGTSFGLSNLSRLVIEANQ